MAKQNSMLARLQARHEDEKRAMRLFTMQQCKDIMFIAANEALGVGPERAKKLSDAFDQAFQEYALMVVQDAKDDKEIWYSKQKLDDRLKEICGEYFSPWEERYEI